MSSQLRDRQNMTISNYLTQIVGYQNNFLSSIFYFEESTNL